MKDIQDDRTAADRPAAVRDAACDHVHIARLHHLAIVADPHLKPPLDDHPALLVRVAVSRHFAAGRQLDVTEHDVLARKRFHHHAFGNLFPAQFLRGRKVAGHGAASEPHTDFTVNANGTLNLLEAARRHKPDATFIFCSTNKVYGDRPNSLPLQDLETRLELPEEHEYYDGIPVSMSIDRCLHSLFGASKVAADVLVQEYGRYFGIKT